MSALPSIIPLLSPQLQALLSDPLILSRNLFAEALPQRITHRYLEKRPIIIALNGPSGSGKSYIREQLVHHLKDLMSVSTFTQDSYYRDFELDFPQIPLDRFYHQIDLDDPAHIRFSHLVHDLTKIRKQSVGTTVTIPQFRFGTPTQKPGILENGQILSITPVIVTEGIHAFGDPRLMDLYDLKLYIHIDEKNRRQRWLTRNARENRGATDNMWQTTINCLDKHIQPTQVQADLVINNNGSTEELTAFLDQIIAMIQQAMPTH